MKFNVAQLLIVVAGICSTLAAVPAFIYMMGGFPHPGRQSDFFIEILFSQLSGSCCIVVAISVATIIAMTIASRKYHQDPNS